MSTSRVPAAARSLPLLLVLISLGCARDAVLFATSTMVGIELNAAENAQQTLKVGYQRIEGVIMPVALERELYENDPLEPKWRKELRAHRPFSWFISPPERRKLLPEAYPVLSLMSIDTGSLILGPKMRPATITQVFATGQAAKGAQAWDTAVMAMGGSSIYGPDELTECIETWIATQENRNSLKLWVQNHGIHREGKLTRFLYGKDFSSDRAKAVEKLGIPCEEN